MVSDVEPLATSRSCSTTFEALPAAAALISVESPTVASPTESSACVE